MKQGNGAQVTGAATRDEQQGAQHSVCWDALRASAIGSLWGRSTATPRIGNGDLWALRADFSR
jgi:hypothetical protein